MIGQVNPEFFRGIGKVVLCQCIDRILHGIGGEDFCVVACCMNGFEITLQRDVDGELPDLMPVWMPYDLRQVDGVLPVCIFI
jgi:hypothetical protein